MMEIDKKIMERLGFSVSAILWPFMSHPDYFDGCSRSIDQLHAWLLSPPGTIAMMRELGKVGKVSWQWGGGEGEKARWHLTVAFGQTIKVVATDLPTAVYEAVKKYLEDK